MEAYYEQKIRDSCTFVKWWSAQVAKVCKTPQVSLFSVGPTFKLPLNDRLSGPDRTRTRHPRSANAMLSQMSYWPRCTTVVTPSLRRGQLSGTLLVPFSFVIIAPA